MSAPTEPKVDPEKPFAGLDGRQDSVTSDEAAVTVVDLIDADEALGFLTNHPRAAVIAIEGTAILEDPVQLKKQLRKIDFTIAPLLAAVYFLQFLDKTTLSYTAVMGIRKDTHLVGQDYSDLSMLFYIGELDLQQKERRTNEIQGSSQRNSPLNTSPNTCLGSACTLASTSCSGVSSSAATQHAPISPD